MPDDRSKDRILTGAAQVTLLDPANLPKPVSALQGEEPFRPADTPKPKRQGLRILLGALITVILLLVSSSAFGAWTVTRSFPKVSGETFLNGLEASVRIDRDGHGIPTITASNAKDLFLAQGYVHAQERFWEMDFRRHLTAGRLSELFGESQLGTDKFLRALDWRGTAEKEVAALPEEIREYYDAYSAGVNAYLKERKGAALSLEYAILGIQNSGYEPEPWTPADSVTWLKAMAWDLRTNIEDETARALLSTTLSSADLSELYPPYPFEKHPVIVDEEWEPANKNVAAEISKTVSRLGEPEIQEAGQVLEAVDILLTGAREGVGSNSWVVAGAHTATGMPLLANDPHLGAELPSVWIQMQLKCQTVTPECPFDVGGFSFSGLPGIVIGHNSEVAWGFTNLTTDVADLFIEKIEGNSYFKDGQKHELVTRNETIYVAGGDSVTYEVRETSHGPILSDFEPDFAAIAQNPVFEGNPFDESISIPEAEYAVALQWTALQPGSTAEAIFTLNTAQNFEDFRKAASLFDVPAQNLIYADREGNIGYQSPGRLPIRGAGTGTLPAAGWDSAYDWEGYIPFSELPTLYNPEKGYIVTANNAIVSDEYPYMLSYDWDYGYRAARIEELLSARISEGAVTITDMQEIQMDNQFPAAQALKDAYQNVELSNARAQEAIDRMLKWDGQNDVESAAAAYANVLWNEITKQLMNVNDFQVSRDNQSRLVLFFEELVKDTSARWWFLSGYSSAQELLSEAASLALEETVSLLGENPDGWEWGELHALPLTSSTFGQSGIKPIEMLFNRGPYPTGGGSGVVNATGWSLEEGYATSTVPSFRMVVDVADWDASTWQNLTGTSGHAFHKHYVDQVESWAAGEQYGWSFSEEAVLSEAVNTLTLSPQK